MNAGAHDEEIAQSLRRIEKHLANIAVMLKKMGATAEDTGKSFVDLPSSVSTHFVQEGEVKWDE